MFHNVERAMVEHSELNPMTKLWMKINSFPFLSEKFSRYNKLAKIVMVQAFESIEDEKTSTIFFSYKTSFETG
jgi:hypothetical protein